MPNLSTVTQAARGLVLVLPLMVMGCAAGSVSGGSGPAFQAGAAEDVLGRGMAAIRSRFIDPVDMQDMTLNALTGLASEDQGFEVTTEGPALQVRHRGITVAQLPLPRDDSPQAWSDLLVTATDTARRSSNDLVKLDAEQTYARLYDSMLASLDSYSRYAGAEEALENRASRSGFGGIGIRYEPHDDNLEVTEVLEDSPGAQAGLRLADRITHVDGDPVKGMSRRVIRNRLRGPVDSVVRLTVVSATHGSARLVPVRRGLIVPPTAKLQLRDGAAIVRVDGFNQTTTDLVAKLIRDAQRDLGDQFRGVVLDMRGNPGGLLDQAVELADLFLTDGSIVTTRGRHPHAMQSYDAKAGYPAGGFAEGIPLVVLMDGQSASASEIVAGALQDHHRAVVVGATSYGKGTVQTVITLPNSGEITLTWSRFHTPSGYAIEKLGVHPDLCTSLRGTTADSLLRAVHHDRWATPQAWNEWREVSVDDEAGRERLRATCPPESAKGEEVPMETATRLLADPVSYAKVIAGFAPSTASR